MTRALIPLFFLLTACASLRADSSSAQASRLSEQMGSETEAPLAQPLAPEEGSLSEQSFFFVWDRINSSYPYEDMRGIEWVQAYHDLLPAAREAQSAEELRPVLESLLAHLGESHFVVHPGKSYEVMQADSDEVRDLSGELGLDIRLVDDHCLVVRVEAGSSAEAAGLRSGDQILEIGEHSIAAWLDELLESGTQAEMIPFVLRRKAIRATRGPPASEVEIHLLRPDGTIEDLSIPREYRSRNTVQFGNLPSLEVIFDEETLETGAERSVGYIYFNIFLGDVVTRFSETMGSFVEANVDGMIIDLRGNPGGLGAMSRGIAGHFVFDSSQSLGIMKTRSAELSFFVVPKGSSQRFEGPLAILMDEQSGSTSEILAGGLQDLGRATIVGSTSAGMALPSVIERMPNGDAIQFVMGDLVTSSGYRIEGQGVLPDIGVELSAESLGSGEDPVVQAALNWIDTRLNHEEEDIP